LGDEKYAEYLAYEQSRRGTLESERFQEYATKQKLQLAPEHRNAVEALIHDAQAYTFVRQERGPLNGIPRPAIGAAEVIELHDQEAAMIAGAAERVREHPSYLALPPEVRGALDTYYAGERERRLQDAKSYRRRLDEYQKRELELYGGRGGRPDPLLPRPGYHDPRQLQGR